MSAAHVTGFGSFEFTVCWLTLNRSLLQFYCIWHCLLTRHWFVQYQQHLYIVVILQYNSGSMAADFGQVTVSIHLFFTWVLCFYIILDKDCHILYVFCLNSTVCSQIVGVHLSSNQVTYSKFPNKRPLPPLFFWKKNLTPSPLLIFGFSNLTPKKFELCKTYLSIRNSINSNEIDFSECLRFQCYF